MRKLKITELNRISAEEFKDVYKRQTLQIHTKYTINALLISYL